MSQNPISIKINVSTKTKINCCRELFIKNNPNMKYVKISVDKTINDLCDFYLEFNKDGQVVGVIRK